MPPGADREYWNPKNELMPRADLERLQFVKLRRQVEWAYARSPLYRRKFDAAKFHPDQLKSLADLDRIPFLRREEWMASQEAHPLFGDILAVPADRALRYHYTSGTSGRTPLRVLDGIKDWHWGAECWAYGFWGFGVRPADIVFLAFSYGSFIGFWGAHGAAEKIGALVIPSGAMTSEARVKQIVEIGATTVCATPTYAMRLAAVASEMGIDLAKGSRVDKLILSGEPAGSIPATKRLIEEAWGAKAGDTAGMSEVGTIIMFECRHQPGGAHIIEDHVLEEVVAPGSDRRVAYGERGERVVTSFGRGILPLIRYRTADMVEKVQAGECRCGRTFDIYRGGIMGRWDDMKLVRGTNVYPRAVEAIVREHPEIDEFQILITREAPLQDEITVSVELKPGREAAWPALQRELAGDLAQAHEGLRFHVALAPPGSLPRFELKARRLIDRRGEA